MAEEKSGMLGRLLEIPKDMVLNLPRISLFGNLQCCVENHQGILQYTPEQIGLQAGKYRIYIEGQELVITSLSAETIYIEGKIGQVRYEI
ncbi:MAG: sporulation protein YqfC [Peptococcaceae bacterium]|nr:sporulation protein YqfC [Peptococcaceae bacterium]